MKERRWLKQLRGARMYLFLAVGLLVVVLMQQALAPGSHEAEASAPAFQSAPPTPTLSRFVGPPTRRGDLVLPPPPATPPAAVNTPVTVTPTPRTTIVFLVEVTTTPVTPTPQSLMAVGPVLLAEAERRQNMQFNPNAALQKRIFADGLVPNSPEFRVSLSGVEFGGQRAESLQTGLVRVYYVPVPDFANVTFVQRPNPRNAAEAGLLAAGENAQVIQFNPNAALQKRMFADGFVPNSPEFGLLVGGVPFIGQRGERLDTGEVRVYFVRDGDFSSVFWFTRG
ncbi:MAG: hypothetical protein U0768_21695 [Anaerolineae bacterium]